MLRSRRCVFLSHCLLAQGVRANGLAKYYPAAIKPVIQFCLDHDINMVQMPCPEVQCSAGGLERDPHGKKWYEEHGLRETCQDLAPKQVAQMHDMIEAGFQILGIIVVEFSPACAATYLNRGPSIYKDQGIFVEELRAEMDRIGLTIPFIGIHPRWHKKMKSQLESLIAAPLEAPQPIHGSPAAG